MPGAGTDHTKDWTETAAPVVILVEPQLGENIGATARAMGNFGLSRLRLIKPVQGWPNKRARVMASGADRILEQAELFDSAAAAVADCHHVFAMTARAHDQAKPVAGAEEAVRLMAPRIAGGETIGLMFGRERNGLENDEVGLADCIVTLPVNPAFASLNLAQAVVILGYEWFKLASAGGLPFGMPAKSPPAPKEQLFAFFRDLERELEAVEYFRPAEKRGTMIVNMRNIFTRMQPSQQDIRTLHGVITALVQGRKGPAKGGVLDGPQAELLRTLLSGQAAAEGAPTRGPMRGLARLLRRNPTDAERIFWTALTNDRRFATSGFKRQTPVGPHVVDFVSFPLRMVIDLVPDGEANEAAGARVERRQWLEERDYRIVAVSAGEVEADVAQVLDRLAARIAALPSGG